MHLCVSLPRPQTMILALLAVVACDSTDRRSATVKDAAVPDAQEESLDAAAAVDSLNDALRYGADPEGAGVGAFLARVDPAPASGPADVFTEKDVAALVAYLDGGSEAPVEMVSVRPAAATSALGTYNFGQQTVAAELAAGGLAAMHAATGRLEPQGAPAPKQRLAQLEAAVAKITANSAIARLVKADPNQAVCTLDGAVLTAGGQCQCRSWGMDIDRYAWSPPAPPPATSAGLPLVARLALAQVRSGLLTVYRRRRCPNLEANFCHGWPTQDGQCGIYQMAATWQTPAYATGAPEVPIDVGATLTDRAKACLFVYDRIIHANVGRLFTDTPPCGELFGLLDGTRVRLRAFDRASGERKPLPPATP